MRKAKDLKLLAIILSSLFALALVFFIAGQSRYLALKIFSVPIQKIELVTYKDKPFESEVLSVKILDGQAPESIEFQKEMNWANVLIFHPRLTSTVLFIHYPDDRLVNAYIDDGCVGLNYGSVWLKIPALEQILSRFE